MARRAPLPDELVTSTCPVPGLVLRDFVGEDAAELLVLQRCCWVQEALANDTLDVPPLHETLDEVLEWGRTWLTLVGRLDHRLVTAVRARSVGCTWQISRLMVAPDLAGSVRGCCRPSRVSRHLTPTPSPSFTGARSERNLRIYHRAGYTVDERAQASPSHVPGTVSLSRARPLTG